MANLNSTIKLPETLAQLIQSHSFSAYLYPQVFALSNTLASAAYNQQINLFGNNLNTSQNLIIGIMNVNKNFKKGIFQRHSLGQGSFEAKQTIPISFDYDFTFDKVVFYNPQHTDVVSQMIDVDSNGSIKQLVPFMMEEVIQNPDGTIKENTFYYDVWITNDVCTLDLMTDDTLVVRRFSAKGTQLITNNNNLVDYAQALNTVSNITQDIANAGNSVLSNFKIPTG
jgi:hypothetical protein